MVNLSQPLQANIASDKIATTLASVMVCTVASITTLTLTSVANFIAVSTTYSGIATIANIMASIMATTSLAFSLGFDSNETSSYEFATTGDRCIQASTSIPGIVSVAIILGQPRSCQ